MKDYSEIIKATFERMSRNQVISPLLLEADQITNEKLQQHAKYVSHELGEKPLNIFYEDSNYNKRIRGSYKSR